MTPPTESAYLAVLALLTPDDRAAVEAHVAALSAPGKVGGPPERSTLFNVLAGMQKEKRWDFLANEIKSGRTPPDLPQCIALTGDGHWFRPTISEAVVHDVVKTGAVYPLAPAVAWTTIDADLVQYIIDVGVPQNMTSFGSERFDIFRIIAKRSALLTSGKPETPTRTTPPPWLAFAAFLVGSMVGALLW